MTKQNV